MEKTLAVSLVLVAAGAQAVVHTGDQMVDIVLEAFEHSGFSEESTCKFVNMLRRDGELRDAAEAMSRRRPDCRRVELSARTSDVEEDEAVEYAYDVLANYTREIHKQRKSRHANSLCVTDRVPMVSTTSLVGFALYSCALIFVVTAIVTGRLRDYCVRHAPKKFSRFVDPLAPLEELSLATRASTLPDLPWGGGDKGKTVDGSQAEQTKTRLPNLPGNQRGQKEFGELDADSTDKTTTITTTNNNNNNSVP